MADEERDVRPERLPLDLVEVLGERAPSRGERVRTKRQRDEIASDRRDRRERVPAIPRQLGRVALAEMADERAVEEQRAVGVTVRVDEPGRHHPAGHVEDQPDLVRAHDAQVADREDPVTEHADIGTPSRDPRAIDDGPAPKEQVEAGHAGHDATSLFAGSIITRKFERTTLRRHRTRQADLLDGPRRGVDVERRLVESARDGDQMAFSQIATSLSPRLFTVAYRILRDYHRAEDVAQQALVLVWRDLPRLADVERFDAWAYRIVDQRLLWGASTGTTSRP